MQFLKLVFYNKLGHVPCLSFVMILMYLSTWSQELHYPHKSPNIPKHKSVTQLPIPKRVHIAGNDGPYIINDTLYRVQSNSEFIKTTVFNPDSIAVTTDSDIPITFHVALSTKSLPTKGEYALPERMVVLSDIEGNFNAFSGFLMANAIIDADYNWIFGKGHLVLLGDFVDRGKNVTQVLWLIYKLEQQAKHQQGQVHFILGNHEILNFNGNHKYNRVKYIEIAHRIRNTTNSKAAVKHLYSEASILGQWLASKNVIERIGNYLFVHAGLSPELLDYRLNLKAINTLVRDQFDNLDRITNRTVQFLYSTKGPFWYRGLVQNRRYYRKIKTEDLNKLKQFYKFKKIVIGHTPVGDISSDYDGAVIRLDVSHGLELNSGKTKGLIIENGKAFILDDLGFKRVL